MKLEQFDRDGFAIISNPFDSNTLRHLHFGLDSEKEEGIKPRGGKRDVADQNPLLRDIAEHVEILKIMATVLGEEAFLVRATLFDKTPEANWKVPWHQDVTIAVRNKLDTPGYGPWSQKAGIHHVQPPSEVLEKMLTIRLHIDPCPAANGALRVMPASHRLGRLNQNEVSQYVDEKRAVCCVANAGDLLVMRPLVLHSSSASLIPNHRRVLHFDFAIGEMANGLKWRMRDYSRPSLFHEPAEQ